MKSKSQPYLLGKVLLPRGMTWTKIDGEREKRSSGIKTMQENKNKNLPRRKITCKSIRNYRKLLPLSEMARAIHGTKKQFQKLGSQRTTTIHEMKINGNTSAPTTENPAIYLEVLHKVGETVKHLSECVCANIFRMRKVFVFVVSKINIAKAFKCNCIDLNECARVALTRLLVRQWNFHYFGQIMLLTKNEWQKFFVSHVWVCVSLCARQLPPNPPLPPQKKGSECGKAEPRLSGNHKNGWNARAMSVTLLSHLKLPP